MIGASASCFKYNTMTISKIMKSESSNLLQVYDLTVIEAPCLARKIIYYPMSEKELIQKCGIWGHYFGETYVDWSCQAAVGKV